MRSNNKNDQLIKMGKRLDQNGIDLWTKNGPKKKEHKRGILKIPSC
jgi:hypothetical protein